MIETAASTYEKDLRHRSLPSLPAQTASLNFSYLHKFGHGNQSASSCGQWPLAKALGPSRHQAFLHPTLGTGVGVGMGVGLGGLQWRFKASLNSKTTTKSLSPQPSVNAGQASAADMHSWFQDGTFNTFSLLTTLVAKRTFPGLRVLLVQLQSAAGLHSGLQVCQEHK